MLSAGQHLNYRYLDSAFLEMLEMLCL